MQKDLPPDRGGVCDFRMKKAIIIFLAAAWAFVGCADLRMDCLITVNVSLQEGQSLEAEVPEAGRAVVYVFAADSSQWSVLSYEDALNGVITSRTTGQTQSYTYTAFSDGEGSAQFQVTESPVMVVVCDRQDEIYAWRGAEPQEGLRRLTFFLTLRPYERETAYVELGWNVVNGETDGPPEEEDEQQGVPQGPNRRVGPVSNSPLSENMTIFASSFGRN